MEMVVVCALIFALLLKDIVRDEKMEPEDADEDKGAEESDVNDR